MHCSKAGRSFFRIEQVVVREFLAEFLGTALLILIGDGSVAQSVLSRNEAGSPLSIHISWGLAVAFGVLVSGSVSGGHLNPAISLSCCFLGRLTWRKLPLYMLAQYCGTFFGASLTFAVYYEALESFDGGIRAVSGNSSTAGIFATYPAAHISLYGGVVDQVVGTAVLSLLVLAITDRHNARLPAYLIPFCVGSVVMAIGMALGFNTGYAINPARDLGPRLFTAAAGWGMDVFKYETPKFRAYQWFWIPFVIPHLGALLGTILYQLAIGNHWPVTPVSSARESPHRPDVPDNEHRTNSCERY